ncbi:MAG: DUF2911 domain-containing protein [Thermoanaerobaculia bacterium]|nr:DUF2911 domain-containing protein [Thermoanaerobaculia bacterium]
MHRTSQPAFRITVVCLVLALLTVGLATAQGARPKSPRGAAATQIGDAWIEFSYSRPILRGRNGIFGSGAEYGTKLYAGAPVWRAGADVTTRIKTEVDLMIGGKKLPAGEYSFFIELKEGAWTAIFSSQPYMEKFDRAKMQEGITWGAYGYDPKNDVLRADMVTETTDFSLDQMTIGFTDVTESGGNIFVGWDNQMGNLAFTVAK